MDIETLGRCYKGIEKAHEGYKLTLLIGVGSAILLPIACKALGERALYVAVGLSLLTAAVSVYYTVQLNKVVPCPICNQMRAALGLQPIDQTKGW